MKSNKRRRRGLPAATTAVIENETSQASSSQFSITVTPALRHRLFPTAILLITFAVFLPVLNNGFVDLDNRPLVSNPGYRGVGWTELLWMVADFHFGQYQPLAWITLALDQVFWWADPFGHHLTNLVFHLANAMLFYFISVELLSLTRLQSRDSRGAWAEVTAAVAALVWAIHPLRVEPVAWASARGEIVAAAFLLLSIFAYLKMNAPRTNAPDSARWIIVSMGAFLLSLLASPSALVLPLVFLLLDHYPLTRLSLASSGFAPALGRLVRQKAPFFFLSGVGIVVAIFARNDHTRLQPSYAEDSFTWTLHQLAAPAFYLAKTILPVSLAPAYELSATHLSLYVAGSGLLCAGAFALRKRWPALAPAWLCYLLLLLPFFRDHFPAAQLLADRHTYLASLPLALCIGAAFADRRLLVPGNWPGIQNSFLRAGVLGAVLSISGVLAWRQVAQWRDAKTLWNHAVQVNPTSRAYYNLASLAEAEGKYDDAIAHNRRVVQIDPSRWDAHERAAALLQRQGKIPQAVEHYRVVVRLNPNAVEARENLAAGLVYQGEIEEAIAQFRKVIESAPERNETRFKLGTVLAVQGRLGDAEESLAAAAKADPDSGRIRLRLGQVLAAQGELESAMPYFRDAVRLLNEDAEAHENLGRGLLELGHKDEAAKHLQEALRIMRSKPIAR